MSKIINITQNGEVVYPITTPEAIVDSKGLTLEQKFASKVDSESLATINGQSLVNGGKDIKIEGATPDWSASEGEEGFIKNRTHYAKYNDEFLRWLSPEEEDNVSFISKQPIEQIFDINDIVYVSCSEFGQVKVDKDDVTLFKTDIEGNLTTEVFGILKVRNEGEFKTFTIFSNYEDGLNVSTSIYKTLDDKFIPDTIARQAEVTELSSEVGKVSEDVEKKVDATYVDNAIAAAITNELNTEV